MLDPLCPSALPLVARRVAQQPANLKPKKKGKKGQYHDIALGL